MRFQLSILCLLVTAELKAEAPLINREMESIQVLGTQQQGIRISTDNLLSLPGTGNDPLKGLEALPGVVLATPNSGGPVAKPAIRGSSVNDNLYLTDGFPVGYVFHNDGLSIYNPLLISGFELQTGAWQSQYANASGGLILTGLRDPNGDNPTNHMELSLIRAGVLVESALSENAAFYASYRESLVHTYVDNFIEDEEFSFSVPPRNRDYQVKMIWDYDADNVVRLLATGAKDYIELAFDEAGRDVLKNPDLATGERYQTHYHSQGLSWENSAAENFFHTIRFSTMQRNQLDREGQILSWAADIDSVRLAVDSQFFTDELTVNFGAELENNHVDYRASGRLLPCNTEFAVCPPSYFSTQFDVRDNLDIDTWQAYVELQSDVNEQVSYRLGIQTLNNSFSDEQFVEPRLSLNYQLNDSHRLSFSAGRHSQWIEDYRFIAKQIGTPSLNAQRSDHYVLAWNWQLQQGWGIKSELFYKQMENLIVANPDAQIGFAGEFIEPNTAMYLDQGEGRAWGAELLVNKALFDDWYGWFSLAVSHADRTHPSTGDNFDYEFNLPVIANLVLDYQFNQNWNFGIKWRYQSGRHYTEVLSADPYIEEGNPSPLFYVPQYGEMNGKQLKDYHRLDIRADYKTELLGYKTNVFLEVLNLYGSRTVQEFEYSPDYSSYEKDYQFPDMPLPSVGISILF